MSLNFLYKIRTTHFYCIITILVLLIICWHCYKVQEGLTEETPCECDSESDSDEEEDEDKYYATGGLMSGARINNSNNPVIKEIVRKNQMVDAYKKMMSHSQY